MITAAIIGAGWVARNCYLPAFRKAGIRLIAVADTSLDAAKRLAEPSGALPTATLKEALLQKPDLCIIATPNVLHARQCMEALRGCGLVLCEKPLAVSLRELAMLKAAAPEGRLFISTPNRFRTDVAALLSVIRGGTIGKPVRIQIIWHRKRGIPRPGSWYTNAALSGGGALIDIGSHAIDCGMMLFGFPRCRDVRVSTDALTDSISPPGAAEWMQPPALDDGSLDVECAARGTFGLDRGRSLEVDVSWNSACDEDHTVIEVTGTSGRARLDTLFGFAPIVKFLPRLTVHHNDGMAESVFNFTRSPANDFGDMLSALLDRKHNGATGPASMSEGVEVARMIMNGYQTAGFPWLAGLV